LRSKLLLVAALLLLILACGPQKPPRTAPKGPAAKPPKTAPAPKPRPPSQPAPKPQPPQPVTPREPVPAQPENPPQPPTEPLLVKVGLASDLESVNFPCCEETLDVAVENQAVPVTAALKVEPAAATAQQGY
jgi:outer membrane biosynthesis protein TonB